MFTRQKIGEAMRTSGPSPASVGGARWKRDPQEVMKFRSWVSKLEEEIVAAAARAEDYVNLYGICYGDGKNTYYSAIPAFWIERMVAEKAFTIETLSDFCEREDIVLEFYGAVLGFGPRGGDASRSDGPSPCGPDTDPSPSPRPKFR